MADTSIESPLVLSSMTSILANMSTFVTLPLGHPCPVILPPLSVDSIALACHSITSSSSQPVYIFDGLTYDS